MKEGLNPCLNLLARLSLESSFTDVPQECDYGKQKSFLVANVGIKLFIMDNHKELNDTEWSKGFIHQNSRRIASRKTMRLRFAPTLFLRGVHIRKRIKTGRPSRQ